MKRPLSLLAIVGISTLTARLSITFPVLGFYNMGNTHVLSFADKLYKLFTINTHEVNVVEYKEQRVITFKMIDELHERPEGTARRNFNANKPHLAEGEDYFVRNSSEAREMGFTAPNGLTLLVSS